MGLGRPLYGVGMSRVDEEGPRDETGEQKECCNVLGHPSRLLSGDEATLTGANDEASESTAVWGNALKNRGFFVRDLPE